MWKWGRLGVLESRGVGFGLCVRREEERERDTL